MAADWDYIAKMVVIGDSGTGKSSLTIRLCENRFVQQHDVTIGVEFGSRVVPVGPPASQNDITEINTDNSNSKLLPAANGTAATEQKQMKLSLWDTAGQETYRSITRSYFRGASGALLVFDVSRRTTFDSVTSWVRELRQVADGDIVIVLVGNKADLVEDEIEYGDEDEAEAEVADSEDNTGMKSTTADNDAGNNTVLSQFPSPQQANRKPNARTNVTATNTTATTTTTTSTNKKKRQVTGVEARDWCRANEVLGYVETSAKTGLGVERAFRRVAERIYQNIEAGRYDLQDRRSGVKSSSSARTGGGSNNNHRQGSNIRLKKANGRGGDPDSQGRRSQCC